MLFREQGKREAKSGSPLGIVHAPWSGLGTMAGAHSPRILIFARPAGPAPQVRILHLGKCGLLVFVDRNKFEMLCDQREMGVGWQSSALEDVISNGILTFDGAF